MPFCSACGKESPDDARFCSQCGTPLAAAEPGQEAVATPEPPRPTPASPGSAPAPEPEDEDEGGFFDFLGF